MKKRMKVNHLLTNAFLLNFLSYFMCLLCLKSPLQTLHTPKLTLYYHYMYYATHLGCGIISEKNKNPKILFIVL